MIFERLPDSAYDVLGDVLRRAPDSQLFLGWEEKWDNLDFAHIPVGVLSQAYELYLRNHAPAQQRREGGYYTPGRSRNLLGARVLPRAGATGRLPLSPRSRPGGGRGRLPPHGISRVGRRNIGASRASAPTRNILRSILYEQIVGFDINEAALRFAALGLYLMSIELDPNPRPVDKLRFEDLRGKVLHRVSVRTKTQGAQLGSLGPLVGDEHVGRYDLVIGNPPWASSTMLPDWNLVRATVAPDRGRAQHRHRAALAE